MFKSLRSKLFLWYAGSLLILVAYFLLFIHYYSIPHGMLILGGLFIVLASAQFVIIFKIKKAITQFTSKIKMISSKNLEERVGNISGEDEIGQLALSFNNLLDRLSSAFQRERQFIGDMAHELKTPLSTLRSLLEVTLTAERSDEEYKKILKEAIAETSELSKTLNNVLDLAWSEAPHQQKNQTEFNLTQLMEEISEIAQKMALNKKITISLSNTPGILISGFKDKLARALLNLVDNAIKYSSSGSKIELILEKTPSEPSSHYRDEPSSHYRDKILISVIDKGLGISEEDLPYIFERFYRGSKTDEASFSQSDKILGSGLGLAITKSIVALHQGEIKVKSKLNKGSTFVIVLPNS